MRRYIKNGIALLILVGISLFATVFYSPTDAPIKGTTVVQRAEEIRKRISVKYDYISVPSVTIQSLNDGSTMARYVIFFDVPVSLFDEAQNAARQGFSTSNAIKKAQDAFKAYRSSTIDLLKLTKQYLVPIDPRMQHIVLQISFPDGAVYGASILVRELPDLKSPNEAWQEKIDNALVALSLSENRESGTNTNQSES